MNKSELYKKLQNADPKVLKELKISEEELKYIKEKLLNDKLGLTINFTEVDNEEKSNYILLEEEKELAINAKDKNNHLLIEGDNYHALKALLKTNIKVDVIYIDPPYNTGKEFVYKDDFGVDKVVGSDDPHKHSKWLSFMKKRLELAKELLSEEGVIFVSIDDNEQAYLKVLMDEIFGEENFLATICRKTSSGSKNDSEKFAISNDYILVYSNPSLRLQQKEIEVDNSKYILQDENGRFYKRRALEMQGGDDTLDKRPNMGYTIYFNPLTNDVKCIHDYSKETLEYELPNAELVKGGYESYRPRMRGPKRGRWRWGDISKVHGNVDFVDGRVYAREYKPEEIFKPHDTFWAEYLNTMGTNELKKIMGDKIFSFPKPTPLIMELIKLQSNKNSIILDFFAGSGTTGQAVMELNEEDGGDRRFILVTNNEMNGVDTIVNPEKGIARAITRERLFRVINGEGSQGEKIEWQYSDTQKSLKNNSVKYLKIKLLNKIEGEFEEIDAVKELYENEFDKDISITDFKE